MKRFVLGKLFIISAALIVLSFISCNQNLKEENSMGKVVISLGNTARNVNTEGLPILDEHNTTITINVAGESEQHHHPHPLIQNKYHASKISVEFPIGTEITVAANVETAAKICWRGEKTLTVAAGVNNVSLELSKTPVNVPGVGFSLNEKQLSIEIGSNKIKYNLTVSKDFTPKIKLDGIGRVYVLYKDNPHAAPATHLTRYTVEGDEDEAFNRAVSNLSEQNQNFINIENIAVDTETGNIFLIEKEGTSSKIYCIIKEAEKFKCYSGNLSGVKVKAAAAYNGTLFLEASTETGAAHTEKLLAYRLKTENNMLELTPAGETGIATISPEGQSGKTDCNDIYADGTGVYVLLSSTSLKGNIYSVGQLIRYEYKNSTFTEITRVGLNSVSLEKGGIAFNDNFFSKPVAFTGWDNDYLYIADDGINIVYEKASEIFRVDGNKNRGAMFCKNKRPNQQQLTFYSSVPWYEEYPVYTPPNTPVLSWEKGTHGMKYWTSADGTKDFGDSDSKPLWESTDPSIKPTDIFCYDQDGNLYIVYTENNDKKVRRFEFNDGSYGSTYESATLDNEPTAIAVDISNGKNCLYYAYEISSENKCFIKKYEWSNDFTIGGISNAPITETTKGILIGITALAANKDGLFAAIKNIDSSNIYKLTVKKYNKDGSATTCEVFTHEAEASHGANSSYNSYTEAINALQINNGILYGIMSEVTQHNTYGGTPPKYSVDGFKNRSVLYCFGGTNGTLSNLELINKTCNDDDKVGYGFYRFIAVQENKLVIASDGAWSILSPECINNIDKVFIYNTTSKAFEVEDGNKSNAKYTLHVVKK